MLTFAQDYRHPRLGASKPSLTLNKPGDSYEQEAESVADHVTRGAGLDGQVQTKATGQDMAGQAAPAEVQEVVSSAGQPLDRATRGSMEARFGHDFGNVRVHTDGKAAESARQINALAYTTGSDIVFGAGRFNPASSSGQRLLAHELTHVVQQTGRGAAIAGGGMVQRQTPGSTDLREDASPLLASALGSTVVDKFALGSPKIPVDGEDSLRYAAKQILFFLKKYPSSTVHIAGHTDTVDTETRNLALGQERADAVKAFLEKQGVPPEIMTTESKGESEPVKPTKNGVAEPLNRRVNVFFRTQKSGISLGTGTLKVPSAPVKEEPKKPILTVPPDIFDRPPGPPFRPPSLWDEMEENQRKIDSFKPPPTKSIGDVVIDGIMDKVAKPIIEKLPKSWQRTADELVRKGLEKGTEKACEAAIDASGAPTEVKEGMKEACKAAWKAKPK